MYSGRGVACGDVGDGDGVIDRPVFWDGDVGGEGRAAEGSQVDIDDLVFDAKSFCHPLSRLQFNDMALSVSEGQRIAREALRLGDGEGGGGVDAPREENDGAFGHGSES